MKIRSFYSLICIIFFTGLTLAADKSKYEKAVDALDNGDCESAVLLLRQFLADNETKLKAQKDFIATVNKQIEICVAMPIKKIEKGTIRAVIPGARVLEIKTPPLNAVHPG